MARYYLSSTTACRTRLQILSNQRLSRQIRMPHIPNLSIFLQRFSQLLESGVLLKACKLGVWIFCFISRNMVHSKRMGDYKKGRGAKSFKIAWDENKFHTVRIIGKHWPIGGLCVNITQAILQWYQPFDVTTFMKCRSPRLGCWTWRKTLVCFAVRQSKWMRGGGILDLKIPTLINS